MRAVWTSFTLFFLTAIWVGTAANASGPERDNYHASPKAVEQYGELPPYVIENQGQPDQRARYYVTGIDHVSHFHGPEDATFAAKNGTSPTVSGIFNAASWMPAGLPGHGIAQGSMFVVTGSNMGPDPLVPPGAPPLSTVMEGSSMEITVGGVTVNALMVYTWTSQLAAVLPSTTPTGEGTLTVTYDGETSAPFPILVVENAFGMFARNQAGSGPAIVQNWHSPVDVRLNSLIESAVVDQYEILWGTGLGAITGDDSGLPPVGNLDVDVQVLVNGTPAVVHYKGRSAEFPGIDQIQFQVPADVEGCYASIAVIANGTVSNFGTMAVNSEGGTCSDPVGFTATDLAQTAQGADVSLGQTVVVGLDYTGPEIPEGSGLSAGLAGFASLAQLPMLQSYGPLSSVLGMPPAPIGGCYVYQGPGSSLDDFGDRATRTVLDAGTALNLTAPFGSGELENNGTTYEVVSEDGNVIDPGVYTFDNGAGGDDVGLFQATISVPASQFAWTNRDSIQSISRGQDLTVTWTGGDDSQEVVLIVGYSAQTDVDVMGVFSCAARVSSGSFTLPSWLLSTLPASSPWSIEQGLTSGLIVTQLSRLDQNRFTAPGLDVGLIYYMLGDYRIVPYE